jgi:hypothetical protein
VNIVNNVKPKTVNINTTFPGDVVVTEDGGVYLRINAAKFTVMPQGYVHFVHLATGEMYHSNSLQVYVATAQLELS